MSVIAFNHASFSYDGKTQALRDILLTLEQGSFTCILGGNGSGKSTLAKLINALLLPDTGNVEVLGHITSNPQNLFFIRSNAGMVFQNPDDQIVASVVEDDVAFGPENIGVPEDELTERVHKALKQVGLTGFAKREVHALSGGQKQRVAFAGALALQPQILILDEAGALLDPRGQRKLFQVCRTLNQSGLTIVYITHSMDEAAQADRVIILENGTIAEDGAPHDVLCDIAYLQQLNLDVPFAAHMSSLLQERGVKLPLCITKAELVQALQEQGINTSNDTASETLEASSEKATKDLSGVSSTCAREMPTEESIAAHKMRSTDTFNRISNTMPSESSDNIEDDTKNVPLLTFKDVSFTYLSKRALKHAMKAPKQANTQENASLVVWGNQPGEIWALQNINLTVHVGDFLGIAGHTGSGKSTLLQLANGILQPTTGKVLIGKLDLSLKKNAREAHQRIGLVFQYPERQLFAATVFDDVAFGPRNLGLTEDAVKARVYHALQLMQFDVLKIEKRNPFGLSGGQQRRVAIAGILAMDPEILVLDEPTAGLDPQAHDSLLALITNLHKEQGKTVIMVSHNMDDLAYHCNRIIILNQGKVFTQGTPCQIFDHANDLISRGLSIPRTLQLAKALGIEVVALSQKGALHSIPIPNELADAIASHLHHIRQGD